MSKINNHDSAADLERRLALMDAETKELVVTYVAALVPREVKAERLRAIGIVEAKAAVLNKRGNYGAEFILRELATEIKGAM